MTAPIGSIIIAAHNEEAVIARTLGHLADLARDGTVDVVVVCNGCADRTADIARGFPGVQVLELAQPSKTGALRAGDRVAAHGPRIYLDADVELTARAAVATLAALNAGAVAGRPPHRFDASRAAWVVRRWYAVRERLPSIAQTLWGAGCYGLSPAGRARFEEFPEIIADDLFIDSLFAPEEVAIVPTDPVVVRTPRRFADLLRILRRNYRSQEEVATTASLSRLGVSAGQRHQARDLSALLRREPARVVDAVLYAAVIVLARLRARIGPAPRWERDASSRVAD